MLSKLVALPCTFSNLSDIPGFFPECGESIIVLYETSSSLHPFTDTRKSTVTRDELLCLTRYEKRKQILDVIPDMQQCGCLQPISDA